MTDYFVEFKPLKKVNANSQLLKYSEWAEFNKDVERDELFIEGFLVELYRCKTSGLSACIFVKDKLVFYYDDSETMLNHIVEHLNFPTGINLFEIKPAP